MKKMTYLGIGLVSVIGLIIGNVFMAADTHVTTVKDNVELTVSNNSLKQENQKLTTENQQLKGVADSLQVAGDSLKATVYTLESTVDNYEDKIHRVASSNDDAKPYHIEVPIPEVSDSTN